MLCYRRWKCIRHSSTTVTTSSEPSLSWHAAAEPPKTALDAYTACSPVSKPSILLQVLITLPVTTATPERSFSTLKRLKTYLRSSMGFGRGERLTSLALIHVHAQTTPVEPVEVVDKFALTGPHKLHFLRYASCFCRVVYFFIPKLWLVMRCEFSIMSLASGGFAPGPRWGTSVPQTPCSASPL